MLGVTLFITRWLSHSLMGGSFIQVIGSVGSDEKLDFIINELGFTSGFNYKKENIADAVQRLAPDGLDIL